MLPIPKLEMTNYRYNVFVRLYSQQGEFQSVWTARYSIADPWFSFHHSTLQKQIHTNDNSVRLLCFVLALSLWSEETNEALLELENESAIKLGENRKILERVICQNGRSTTNIDEKRN